ncbi:MAG: octanoyltransferase [Verrucomicrobia bacterium]|nr:MAG: octanoyltransferase [Verrucomicrobiota bacterium]PYK95635.1 MAG: octanoyltransferase [Verrucomicrobiota bacterium]PYL56536.1 MAG: octanoyltransferase [Verrucomicrobiota bacterium]
MNETFAWRWLGRMNFQEALALQEELVAKKRENRNAADEFLLLEHEPVYTIGRTPDQSSLVDAAHLPHPLFAINRGGQATYHGPGQLIGYPIIDLRRCGQDLHRYLRWLEKLLIKTLAIYEISAKTRPGLTGVWIENRKIASIGVGVRHWITMHGFALNVCGDLTPFDRIIPCGIQNVTMTSIEKETGMAFSPEEVGRRVAEIAFHTIANLTTEGSLIQIAGSPITHF